MTITGADFFLSAECRSCVPKNNVKALKCTNSTKKSHPSITHSFLIHHLTIEKIRHTPFTPALTILLLHFR